MEPLPADRDGAMAWIKGAASYTLRQAQISAGALVMHLNSLWKCVIVNCTDFSGFLLRALTPAPILAFSVLSVHLHRSPQSLPLSAAGYREGEGKPGGADGALFQGAAWTSSLRQHQERRHTRPDVSKLR